MFIHLQVKDTTDVSGHEVRRYAARPRRDRSRDRREAETPTTVTVLRKKA